MATSREELLAGRLADERRRRVAFVSHCLLNENTRYLGGAFKAGAVPEVVTGLLEAGLGISQMPCPEQGAWGGVSMRLLLRAYGIETSTLYALRGPLLRLFVAYTRLAYARLASCRPRDRRLPTCRIRGRRGHWGRLLALLRGQPHARHAPLAGCNRGLPDPLDRPHDDERARGRRLPHAREGLFTQQLHRRLERRGITVPFVEYDIVAELRGDAQDPVAELLAAAARGDTART